MGPRPFSRGKYRASPRMPRQATKLQWGRDLSAAESDWLSGRTTGRIGFNGAATFQPRKACRSAEQTARHCSFNGAATFQPRKAWPPAARHTGSVLQWGRDLSAAESHTLRCRAVRFRFNGAATFQPRKDPPVSDAVHRRCFNGAATFQSRKAAGRERSVADGSAMLQWGRDLSAAERLLAAPTCAGRLRASMGPRPFSRGKRRPSRGRPCRMRFNGAATFQPRKAAGGRRRRRDDRASMGPRPFSRGKHGERPTSVQRADGFNGAATFQSRKGQLRCRAWTGRQHWLQWGRDLSVAESRLVSTWLIAVSRLQWGRDLSVAESRRVTDDARPTSDWLQWGRDLSVAERMPGRMQIDRE